jgi:quaternary ammonium compound-resistance protein SugE
VNNSIRFPFFYKDLFSDNSIVEYPVIFCILKEYFLAWFLLFSAGLAEIVFALSLKYNEGFTKLWPSVATMASGGCSFYLLVLAIKTLPLGTAYAVWTGMGAVGVAILGIVLFRESYDWHRLLSITMVVAGIIGLKLTDKL